MDIIENSDGFLVINKNLVFYANTIGEYYAQCIKNKKIDTFLHRTVRNISVKIRPIFLKKDCILVIVGNPSSNKKNWNLLASLMIGISIPFSEEKISSLITFSNIPNKKESQEIHKEATKIQKLIKQLEKIPSASTQTSVNQSTENILSVQYRGFDINTNQMEMGKTYHFNYDEVDYSISINEKNELEIGVD